MGLVKSYITFDSEGRKIEVLNDKDWARLHGFDSVEQMHKETRKANRERWLSYHPWWFRIITFGYRIFISRMRFSWQLWTDFKRPRLILEIPARDANLIIKTHN